MVLYIHSNATYPGAPKAKSHAVGLFFLVRNKIEWTNWHSHITLVICCWICCWGRIWCSLCQCQRCKNHPTHSWRNVTPSITHTNSLWGFHHHWKCKRPFKKLHSDIWKCNTFRLQIRLHENNSLFTGCQVKKILQTTSLSITHLYIIPKSDLNISTWITPQSIFLEPLLKVAWNGVLELTPTSTVVILLCLYFQLYMTHGPPSQHTKAYICVWTLCSAPIARTNQ